MKNIRSEFFGIHAKKMYPLGTPPTPRIYSNSIPHFNNNLQILTATLLNVCFGFEMYIVRMLVLGYMQIVL